MMEKMIEMKVINLQRSDFKDTVKKYKIYVTGSSSKFCQISLRQLKVVLSRLFDPQVVVCMPDNIRTCS